MTTLIEIVQRVADALDLRTVGVITQVGPGNGKVFAAMYPFISTRTDASNRRFEGNELYVDPLGSPAAPNPTGVSAFVVNTGELDVSPAYTTPPDVGDRFDIFTRGVGLAAYRDAVNRALRNLRFEGTLPITYVADGTMDAPDAALWSGVGAIASKIDYGPFGGHGANALAVANSAPGGRAVSQAVAADPLTTRRWTAWVTVRAVSGTAILQVVNPTGGAVISSASRTAAAWGTIALSFDLPLDVRSFAFTLGGVEATAGTEWDDLIAYPVGATTLPLPAFITSRDQVRRVWQGDAATGRIDTRTMLEGRMWDVVSDPSNTAYPWRLMVPVTSGPLWATVAQPFPTLTNPEDETFCDPEWLTLAAEVELLKRLAGRSSGQEVQAWRERLYGVGRQPGRLHELKVVNSRRMPQTVYQTVPA